MGQKKPNAWDLYDIHGNVWQWCCDVYEEEYYRISLSDEPTGPSSGKLRVRRGGSWPDGAVRLRAADRYYGWQNSRSRCVGFRVARNP